MIGHLLHLLQWMSLTIMLSAISGRAFGFTANGHNVIEATAYRHILAQANIARLSTIAGRTFSGKDALDLLIAYRILDAPRGWRKGFAKDPLNTLPIIRSGNLDYILSRQFEGNSQCFHFMARASDVYWDTTTDPTFQYPHMLYDSAYPRCIAFLTSTFNVVLTNALAARSGDHDVYALMHCIADSYSAAHVERDSDGTRTGKPWAILYLKVWEPTAFIPYLFHPWAKPFYDGPWGHKMTDDRDYEYWNDAVKDSTCSSATNPYQVDDDCLSPRALQAVDALQELLIVMAENVLREHLYHGVDTVYEHASWNEYLAAYFAGWKQVESWGSNVAPARHLRPDEREWRPLLHVGLEYHPTSTIDGANRIDAQDITADFNLDIPIALSAPITPGIFIDAGEREYHSIQPSSSQLIRIGYAMAFEFADDFEVRTIPFEREFLLTPGHRGETRNLVSFLSVEGIIDRQFWFRLEAPRFSSKGWVPNDYGISAGFSDGWDFGKWFSEQTGEDEPLALQKDKWHVPDSADIQSAKLGSGKSISATIINMEFNPYANQLFEFSAQLLWDRNSSGERTKGFSSGVELDYAPNSAISTTGANGAITTMVIIPPTVEAGYVLRYYVEPHLAVTALPIQIVKSFPLDGATGIPHPAGTLAWDAQTTIGVMAMLLHTDVDITLLRISWRDAANDKNPFYQNAIAGLRIGLDFFLP